MALKSRTTGSAMAVEMADGRKFLMVDVTIDCDVCGTHTVRIAGHHLRAIRQFLTETIDEFPELCLREGDVQALESLRFSGPSNNPETS